MKSEDPTNMLVVKFSVNASVTDVSHVIIGSTLRVLLVGKILVLTHVTHTHSSPFRIQSSSLAKCVV